MMELGVKWVYQAVRGPGKVRMEAGQKPSLCFKGREYMLCVGAAHPVRVFKRPVRDFNVLRTVVRPDGQAYSARDAAVKLLEIAARNGITVGAQKLLQRALDSAVEVDESQFQDEEELTSMETVVEGNGEASPDAQEVAIAAGDAAANVAEVTKPKGSKRKAKAAKAEKTAGDAEPKVTTKAAAKPAKAAKAAKATKATKATKAAKSEKQGKAPSRISQAVEWMHEQIKKKGGQSKLERGELKEMFAKGAEKFGLSTITMSIQYGKQVKDR